MERKFDPTEISGFKILNLKLQGNNVLGDISIDFFTQQQNLTEIYTTVLIGPNGTGKSYILGLIVLILKNLSDHLNWDGSRYREGGSFLLTFASGNRICHFSNHAELLRPYGSNEDFLDWGWALLVDGELADPDPSVLPDAVIANSLLLTDKFPTFGGEHKLPYQYLGVKNGPNQASSPSYIRRVVNAIVLLSSTYPFRLGLEKATKFLGFGKSIVVNFQTKNSNFFFTGNLELSELNQYFEEIEERYKKSGKLGPYKLFHFQSLIRNEDAKRSVCDFCNELVNTNRLQRIPNTSAKLLSYDVTEEKGHTALRKENELLEHLRLLQIISSPELQLANGHAVDLQQTSSGEYHFFSTIVGLMATAKPNSLILIDEPEISLHPNWQMKYLTFLRELLSHEAYATSHIMIATHSHFLVSDLKGENSTIVGLTKIENQIQIAKVPKNINTYGWSAEEVLYSIFNVRTTRNHYFEFDLNEMVKLINDGSKDYETIKRILDKLQTIVLGEADPLNVLIEKAKVYLSQND